MAPTDLSKVVIAGTATFKADKTEDMAEMISGTMKITFPSSCLVPSGSAVDCNEVTAGLTTAASKPGAAHSAATCQAGGGGCICDVTLKPISMTKTLTYTTSAAVLTETESDGTVNQSTYCVSGTTLTQHTDGKMIGNDGLTSTITLTKQ